MVGSVGSGFIIMHKEPFWNWLEISQDACIYMWGDRVVWSWSFMQCCFTTGETCTRPQWWGQISTVSFLSDSSLPQPTWMPWGLNLSCFSYFCSLRDCTHLWDTRLMGEKGTISLRTVMGEEEMSYSETRYCNNPRCGSTTLTLQAHCITNNLKQQLNHCNSLTCTGCFYGQCRIYRSGIM